MNATTDKPLPQWTYSSYRATLKRNGESYAIVTSNGRDALSEKDANALLALLNTRAASPADSADTRRLDWLEKQCFTNRENEREIHFDFTGTLRAAIDAAASADVAPAKPDYLYSKCCHFGVTTINGQTHCIHCAKPCETYKSSRRVTPPASAGAIVSTREWFEGAPTSAAETPRTEPYRGYWATKYVGGKTIFDHACALETELAAAKQAIDGYAAVIRINGEHHELIVRELRADLTASQSREREAVTLASEAADKRDKAVAEVERLKDDGAFLEWIRLNCRVIHFVGGSEYPLEHTLRANKDMWQHLRAAAKPTP